MSKCPKCKKDIGKVALVNLVFTWESVKNELVETGWHKSCYLSAQHTLALDDADLCACGEPFPESGYGVRRRHRQ